MLRIDKFQLSGCQQESHWLPTLQLHPYGGRGWVWMGERVGTGNTRGLACVGHEL